ncbi:uncharacterized protein LOC134497509 isoform X2 [Candoia aspera]|uniref:uncharacterized protein LOC134497509 isoform X2 n=1 Tax=Candoia aspera TaxID=51853 RepID=UPI002FD82448
MGFSEGQVQAAIRAGCLSAPQAADWLLREGADQAPPPSTRRLLLRPRASEPRASDAFHAPRRPPEDGPGAGEPAGGGLPQPRLFPAGAGGASAEPAARDRLGRAENRAFADRRREQLVQQLKADRRTQQRERELALQRIADDRRQNRATARPPAPRGGTQPPGDAQCLLVIRLPAGEPLRRCLPADSSLESVHRLLLSLRPELSPACFFLQGFPKRRFGPADLPLTLLALGLAPGATLCVVDPASGAAPPAPSEPPPAEGSACPRSAERPAEPGSPARQGGLAGPPLSRRRWGVPPTAQEPAGRSAGPPHQWPRGGNLLRETEGSGPGPLELPLAVAQAAEQRLQQAAAHGQGERSRPGSASPAAHMPPSVPSLFQLSLQGTTALLSAPSKQYCSSLAMLTPGLAELLLEYMVQQALLHPRNLRLFFGCRLQKLCLDCYPYTTNQLLCQLQAFPSLRQLSLFSCSLITDHGLSVVQRLPHLQRLNLSACVKLTNNCLQFLKGLSELSHLALDQTRVSDRGLAELLLAAPPALSHLSLSQTSVTEDTLRLLPQCVPQLRELSLKQTGITDVSSLRRLEALQRLYLDGTRVSEASLGALSSHPALHCLTLSGVHSVDGNRALELVAALPLTRLGLPNRHTVTDVGLAAVCRLAGLLELDLTDYMHITDEGLWPLPRLGRLRRLSLANTLVTDCGLQHLRALQLLEELCLDRLSVSSAGVAHCVVSLPHLQVLSLASTAVGDSVARLGLARCRQLLKLNLSHTLLTDRGLRFLGQVSLVQLNLDGSGVTAAGVADLLAACPTLASVRSSRLRVLSLAEALEEEESGH